MPIDCSIANSLRLLNIPVIIPLKKFNIPTRPIIPQRTPPKIMNIFLKPSNSSLMEALLSYISPDDSPLVILVKKLSAFTSAL